MPQILIIDSNTAEINSASSKCAGAVYADALMACQDDLKITIAAPYDGDDTPDLSGVDGVVFTGSGVEWNTDDPRAEPLAQVMRAVFAKGIPTLGSCNGMQLAASVLGGCSSASPNGHEDGLAREIRLTDAGHKHPFMRGRRDGYAVPCVHRDEVRKLPNGAILLAGNAHSHVQAFVYEMNGIRFWGVQYHPEYTPEFVSGLMARLGRMPEPQISDLGCADVDVDAASRLGIRPEDMGAEVRLTELRNWLASL